MSLSTQPYKGARDFYPEAKRLQKFMFSKLRSVVESYGYEEYDAPILEPLELYLAKSGEEIVNDQTYNFTDRGGREVVIRPEMTPTVSRMVAGKRQELGYPLRWYSIPNLWRYERPQRGRLREHWQLNVDIFGVEHSGAETELIQLVSSIFSSYGATSDMFSIKLNSRPLIDSLLKDYVGLSAEQQHDVSKLIDRMHKMSAEEFLSQLLSLVSENSQPNQVADKLLAVLKTKNLNELPESLQATDAYAELTSLFDSLSKLGISNVVFDPTLMRGFDYYTGVVFEVSDTHPDNNRSMMGGGRYDGLVGLFGVDPVPTVGFGLGDATLENFLTLHDLLPEPKSETDLFVVTAGAVDQAALLTLCDELRQSGLNVALDLSGRKLADQFKTAAKKSISSCLIVGAEEQSSNHYTFKDLDTGESKKLSVAEVISQFSKQAK